MPTRRANIAFINGQIISVDDAFSIAQALWIDGGVVQAIGSTVAVTAACGDAQIVDLKGKSITPGFIDTHGHIALFGLDELKVQLSGALSKADIIARVSTAALSAPHGAWLITTPIGTAPYFLDFEAIRAAGQLPSRTELDRAAPYNPVYVMAPTNRVPNSAILNSAALSLAGITAATETNGPIEIVLDVNGAMTGELRGAMQPLYNPYPFYERIANVIPQPSYADRLAGIRALGPQFAAGGTTTLLEAHLTHPEELRAYAQLIEDGALPLRVFFTFEIDGRATVPEIEAFLSTLRFAAGNGFGTSQLKVVGISAGLDGPYWHGAAANGSPYPGPFGDIVNPSTLMPADKYAELARLAIAHDFRLHTECAGRASIGLALETLKAANASVSIKEKRFVIEHCEFPTRDHIQLCAELGVIPTTSTNFIWGKGAEVYEQRLGQDYAERAIPLREWLDAGVPVCQSTDWGPRDALFTLWQSLVRHAGLTGRCVGESQHISREEAIRIFTINGAYALGMEHEIGSLEVGKRADLVVLSGDLMNCAVDEIRKMDVLLTLRD
ncbi:MAG: amidohydrolase family protein, partial [Proteobacteria bacterium]|nr:amidohydrolase family protein [Pseudomonadota bacterium]